MKKILLFIFIVILSSCKDSSERTEIYHPLTVDQLSGKWVVIHKSIYNEIEDLYGDFIAVDESKKENITFNKSYEYKYSIQEGDDIFTDEGIYKISTELDIHTITCTSNMKGNIKVSECVFTYYGPILHEDYHGLIGNRGHITIKIDDKEIKVISEKLF